MGSGLVKCFVSNQTIPEGMPVVIFPIMQAAGYHPVSISRGDSKFEMIAPNNTTVYANCLYGMQGIYFTSLADDYAKNNLEGSLENKYSFIALIQFLAKYSYVAEQGENEYHEKAFDMKKLLKKHKIVVGQIVKNKKGQDRFDYFPATHEPLLKSLTVPKMNKVYEELLELADANRIYVNEYHETPRVFKFAICLKEVFDYAIREDNKGDRNTKTIIEGYLKAYLDPNDKMNKAYPEMTKGRVAECFSKLDGESATQGYREVIHDILDTMPKKLTPKHIPELLSKLNFAVVISSFQRYLNHNNVLIQPITGYHQDYHNDIGKRYAKLVEMSALAVSSFVKEKYGEDEDESEEYEG